jgi:hypothetical protein
MHFGILLYCSAQTNFAGAGARASSFSADAACLRFVFFPIPDEAPIDVPDVL